MTTKTTTTGAIEAFAQLQYDFGNGYQAQEDALKDVLEQVKVAAEQFGIVVSTTIGEGEFSFLEGKSAYHFKINKGNTTYTMTLRYLTNDQPYHLRIAEEKDGRVIGRKGIVAMHYIPSKQIFVLTDANDTRSVVTAIAATIYKTLST